MAPERVSLAVVGAGLVGRRHAEAIRGARSARLAALVDPREETATLAEAHGVPWFRDLAALLAAGCAEGVILATPNRLHVEGGLACIAAGLPVLVEKPLAEDTEGAATLVRAAEAGGVPLATGHHRRHNPLVRAAKALIEEGRLGRIASVQATTWFRKPDAYFDAAPWRRQAGAGPVLVNLVHDLDLLMHFAGPVRAVQAMAANAVRGFEVEDTAAILLRFEGGALGTVSLCDATPAPWSWELTARENPAYPATDEGCYRIAGTAGSLSLPDFALWTHAGDGGWWDPISATRFPVAHADPLAAQVEQFAEVIRDGAPPLVSGRDGLAAVAVIAAISEAPRTGATVEVRA
ncbi:Gfo/Idh/MocA family protein [Roseicyclus sp.]|uniref:Gfo/Idh/MocA family protein n=1 Tax=Roseicyclus sp. TaxID=1914329 RepID=UPI003F9F394B